MRWEDPKTNKKYEYSWGFDNIEIKPEDIFGIKKENKKNMDYVNAMAKYGAQAEIKLGNVTFLIRINTINQSYDEISFECTALYDPCESTSVTTSKNTSKPTPTKSIPSIKDVIFNDPATIILWSDNTKTVVKCGELDAYDPEMGMAMAIAKKALGNEGNYYEYFKKWLKNYEPKDEYKIPTLNIGAFIDGDYRILETVSMSDYCKNLFGINDEVVEPTPEKKPKWVIHWGFIGENETHVYHYKYSTKYSAERAARRMFGEPGDLAFWHIEEV